MMKQAFRQTYSWSDSDSAIRQYEKFLKKHILQANPDFYGVVKKVKVDTVDGVMVELHLTTAIDDPSLDVVAECVINNQRVYLWRDIVWTLARDEAGDLFHVPADPNRTDFLSKLVAAASSNSDMRFDKIITVYPIGRNITIDTA